MCGNWDWLIEVCVCVRCMHLFDSRSISAVCEEFERAIKKVEGGSLLAGSL